MQPTTQILQALADLLAADTTTLANAAALHVHLAMATFTPGPNLTVADFTEATFTGATAKNVGIGAQQVFTDPLTQRRIIQLLEPAGGWTWEATALTNLPQTIFGWYVTDNTDADLYGCELLPSAITLTAVGEAIVVPNIRFTFLPNSPF